MKLFFILGVISAIATLIVLVMGVMTMGRDGDGNKQRGNKMMRLRVFLQFSTLIFFMLAAAMASAG